MLASELRVGLRVIVARRVSAGAAWVPSMDKTVGRRGRISEVFEDGSGAQVGFQGDDFGWAYPPEALDVDDDPICEEAQDSIASLGNQIADHLKAARDLAERHAQVFAESLDQLPIDESEAHRGVVVGLRMYLRDFDRLIRVYERRAGAREP